MTRTERVDVRLTPEEWRKLRAITLALQRSTAGALRFLIDREYRAMKGHPEETVRR